MSSPRRPSLIVVFSITLVAGVVAFGVSCRRGVDDAPDASVSCNPGAHVFCAPDAGTGCDVLPNDPNPRLAKLAPGRYATGCVANYVAQTRDVGGDCVVDAICRCSEPTTGTGLDAGAGAPSHWSCFP